jgi:hypothetical protein
MELKDVILSTLAEMEEELPEEFVKDISRDFEIKKTKVAPEKERIPDVEAERETDSAVHGAESELMYLSSIRERLLVLFEGFQAPNNKDIEAKVDMTLNFLEYVLATIDSRAQKLEKGNQQ